MIHAMCRARHRHGCSTENRASWRTWHEWLFGVARNFVHRLFGKEGSMTHVCACGSREPAFCLCQCLARYGVPNCEGCGRPKPKVHMAGCENCCPELAEAAKNNRRAKLDREMSKTRSFAHERPAVWKRGKKAKRKGKKKSKYGIRWIGSTRTSG